MRTYSDETRCLLERIESVGRALDPKALMGTDIVHWDLHPGNVLVRDGTLVAIIDCDHANVGDAAFDLVLLAVTSRDHTSDDGLRERLWTATGAISEDRRAAYVAHVLLRVLDWSIRSHGGDDVARWVEESYRLLPDG